VLGVIACHAWIFAMFPAAAQRQLWGETPDAALATSFFPERAQVTREAGGFRVGGRWKFSSGAAHCQAVLIMAMVPRPAVRRVSAHAGRHRARRRAGRARSAGRGAGDTRLGGAGEIARAQASVQMRIAEAQAELDAAWALVRQDRALILADGAAGRFPDTPRRAGYRLHLGYATKLCVAAMERLYPLGGARFIDLHNPLQRAWRDVHAVSQHIGLVWDIQAINFGAVRLGLDCPDPRV
jgi:hypothetical protein